MALMYITRYLERHFLKAGDRMNDRVGLCNCVQFTLDKKDSKSIPITISKPANLNSDVAVTALPFP